jgi:hypothetical protein
MIVLERFLVLLIILSRFNLIVAVVVVSKSLTISLALVDLVQYLLVLLFISIILIILPTVKACFYQIVLQY